MTEKSLKDKAIKFQGKDYVLISDRVNYFNETYPEGCIKTELLSTPEADMVVVKATVFPNGTDQTVFFNGMSQAKWSDTKSFVNKTSALENAETSAVGRALAFMGIGVIDSIASIDEINKTTHSPQNAPKTTSVVKGGEVCPKCGGGLKEIVSKKNGKTYLKCENGTFNNGVAGGCDFFKENKPVSSDEDIY